MRHGGVLLGAAVVLVLGACSSSDSGSGIEPLEPEPTSAVITDTSAADPGERPDDEKTEAGAIAFSEFAVRSIFAARATADGEDFLALSSSSCQDCAEYGREIAETPSSTYRYDGPIEISEAEVSDSSDEQFVIDQVVDVPVGQEIDATDDSVVSEIDARSLPFRVLLVWTGEQWSIGGYTTSGDSA